MNKKIKNALLMQQNFLLECSMVTSLKGKIGILSYWKVIKRIYLVCLKEINKKWKTQTFLDLKFVIEAAAFVTVGITYWPF